jgi:hypothetical protein
MKTTIDHLLTPRFEVIGPYPNSPYKVGDIMNNHGSDGFHITTTNEWSEMHNDNVNVHHHVPVKRFLEYPNLFRPLQWWEKRTADEMPMYLKIDNVKLRLEGPAFSYYKVLKWHMDILFAQVKEDRMSGCSLLSFSPEYTYQPCSEEEYLSSQERP